MSIFSRIGLWFGSLLLAVALFSLPFALGGLVSVFRVTMIFALPAAVLYLPLVVAFKDAEGRRARFLLASGVVIGPICLVLWGLILQLRGGNPQMIWVGDGLDQGVLSGLVYALVVGSMTAGCYVAALKIAHRRCD